jgi:hypothetical protein
MSNQNPYEQLGVAEDSSFEEIKSARDVLMAQHEGDRKQLETIEAAYDAVLMERLRMRQEGKIKVPDRIRFPEKTVQPAPNFPPPTSNATSDWLKRLIDTPSPADIWIPAGIFALLSVAVVYVPVAALQFVLIAGVCTSFYFLYRKEQRLGRAVLLGLVGFIVGFLVGGIIWTLLRSQLLGIGLIPSQVTTMVAFVVLWLVSSFLR